MSDYNFLNSGGTTQSENNSFNTYLVSKRKQEAEDA